MASFIFAVSVPSHFEALKPSTMRDMNALASGRRLALVLVSLSRSRTRIRSRSDETCFMRLPSVSVSSQGITMVSMVAKAASAASALTMKFWSESLA